MHQHYRFVQSGICFSLALIISTGSSSTSSLFLPGFVVAPRQRSARDRLRCWILLPTPGASDQNNPITRLCNEEDRLRFKRSARRTGDQSIPLLFASSSSETSSSLPDVDTMKAREIRNELNSYGISTKSFLEKKEMVEALKKARAEEKKTIAGDGDGSGVRGGRSAEAKSKEGLTREERIAAEVEKCQTMRVSELKEELRDYGVSTRSFFEKSEFVRALAEARVDGKKKRSGSSTKVEEDYDPEYKDVVMQKFNPRDSRLLSGGAVIDISIR